MESVFQLLKLNIVSSPPCLPQSREGFPSGTVPREPSSRGHMLETKAKQFEDASNAKSAAIKVRCVSQTSLTHPEDLQSAQLVWKADLHLHFKPART